MALHWVPELSVGIDKIDNQHKELFITINELVNAMSQGRGREEIGKTVDFLQRYVVAHFGVEEKYMADLGYPHFANHKQQHEKFVQDFLLLREQLETQGSSSFMVMQIQRRICDWLVNHIGRMDKSLGVFLTRKAA